MAESALDMKPGWTSRKVSLDEADLNLHMCLQRICAFADVLEMLESRWEAVLPVGEQNKLEAMSNAIRFEAMAAAEVAAFAAGHR